MKQFPFSKMFLLPLVALMCFPAPVVHADDEEFKPGEQMPEYATNITWLKEIDDSTPELGSKAMVIEYWATWCAPCKYAIPHLTKLQNKYGAEELSIVGLTIPDDRQSEADIKKFVQRQGKRMDYWVGTFEDKKASDGMQALADLGILPMAVIVGKEGRIQFIGHPMDPAFDDILDLVVKGRYDFKSATKAKSHIDEIKRARSLKNWNQYYKLSDEVIEINPQTFYKYYLERFDVELMDRDNKAKAYADARKLMVDRTDDPQMLAWLSEHIATSPDIPDEKRDLDVALDIIKSARTAGGENDPMLMAMEAKIRMARGELEEAVKLQRRAYFIAPRSTKAQYKRDLQSYKSQMQRSTAE